MRGRVPTPRPRLIKSQDHPRVCGEEHHPTPSSAAPRGSPPRMRGRGFEYVKQYGEAGITPAYAGKRIIICPTSCPVGDHPRVCGEELCHPQRRSPSRGSPPRMRGRVFVFTHINVYERITPAYAGKSLCHDEYSSSGGDHPRVCGEERSGVYRYDTT